MWVRATRVFAVCLRTQVPADSVSSEWSTESEPEGDERQSIWKKELKRVRKWRLRYLLEAEPEKHGARDRSSGHMGAALRSLSGSLWSMLGGGNSSASSSTGPGSTSSEGSCLAKSIDGHLVGIWCYVGRGRGRQVNATESYEIKAREDALLFEQHDSDGSLIEGELVADGDLFIAKLTRAGQMFGTVRLRYISAKVRNFSSSA